MDAKDLQNEATLGERNNDGSKYASGGVTLPYSRNKSYQDISSVSLGKVDAQNSRPCAVIGPDRVLPPPVSNDTLKKSAYEAWYSDSVYRHQPEYPHKMTNYHTPIRNISPRQTFQENMQRIMVPPSYNSVKGNEEHHFPMDKNVSLSKNIKPNIPFETKYCEVPYSGSLTSNEQKSVRNTEQSASNVNPVLTRGIPQGWPPHVRPPRPYGAPELYQYPEYANCSGPRPVPMSRPHRTTHEDPSHGYPDPYCHDGNIRFKPYTTVKDRYTQARYEFIGNYPSPYHPTSVFPTHKYDMPKSIPQPYTYPQVPLKYLDSRMPDPLIDGYQRPAQQNTYNFPFHNQMIHPSIGPVPGNCIQNRFPCPPEGSLKSVAPNKPYDTNKMYAEYENARAKGFPISDNYYFNDMQRPPHHVKNQVMPNYPVNVHGIPTHPYYRKDGSTMKNYEYMPHYRNIDPSLLSQSRIPSQFSPNAITISPPDTNLNLESTQIQGSTQDDCGYVSQSPTASMRSGDYINRSANEFYRRYDSRYGPTIRPPIMAKPEQNPNGNSKDKKDIDVRQFLQMWSEVDDENAENGNKEAVAHLLPNDVIKGTSQYETVKNQDQLYVLGLVNVPSDELGKYEHIQKVSKLPENIKGYNSIELLKQFEEVIESSNVNSFKTKPSNSRDMSYQMSMKNTVPHHSLGLLPRPVSPLDVEAKISQSVIHKEVGCNFEIKPCSPKMLNVEAATPIQNLISERAIEKVSNPLIVSPPDLHEEDNSHCKMLTLQNQIKSPNENLKNISCKMTNTQFNNNDSVRPNYSIHDLESNSGVCLASLPRLDNDIELNFPEVNQQFINANKGESVITATKDLPLLINMDSSENEGPKTESSLREEPHANYELPPFIDSERGFSKLSKYRKIKKCEPEYFEKETSSLSSTQYMRTDSVIIKNPENPKLYEHNKEIPTPDSLVLTQDKENFVDEVSTETQLSKTLDTSIINTPMDIAIDFSLSKNDNDDSVSNSVDSNIGNRIKSTYINEIKYRPKMSQKLQQDLEKAHETQTELQQVNEFENLIKYKTEDENQQLQENNDYHDKPKKCSIVINEHSIKQSEISLPKKCDETKEFEIKSQDGNSSSSSEVVENKSITEERRYNDKNYEHPMKKDGNKENDNGDTNIDTQTKVYTHFDSSIFKEDNSCALSPCINDNMPRFHKSGSFELLSEESDGYDTDSTRNEINKLQEISGTAEYQDKNKIENSDTKEHEIDEEEERMAAKNDENETNIIEQIPIDKQTRDTKEILNKMVIIDNKLKIVGDVIETNAKVESSDIVDETEKKLKNEVAENDINKIGDMLTITVEVGENSDIKEDIGEGDEKSHIEEDANIVDEVKEITDIEDINEADDEKSDKEKGVNKPVEIKGKFDTDEINIQKDSVKFSETENMETSQINDKLLLENVSPEDFLDHRETVVNDTDEIFEEPDTNKIFNNVETLDETTDISHVKKLSGTRSVTNENSPIDCNVFKINTEYSENEKTLSDCENKSVNNFSISTNPSTKTFSLSKCETFNNCTNEITMELNTKKISETEENVVSCSKNTDVVKLHTDTTLLLGCVYRKTKPNNCKIFKKSAEFLLELDSKQIPPNKKENQTQKNDKCEVTNEQLQENIDEVKNNDVSCKEIEISQTVSTVNAFLENAHSINKLSNQSDDSNDIITSNENVDLLQLPFEKSLSVISPVNTDEDSSYMPLSKLDMPQDINKLDHNDSYYDSTSNICTKESSEQHPVETNVPSIGDEIVCEKLENQKTSDVIKITYVTTTISNDIGIEDSSGGKINNDVKEKLGLKKELFSPFIQKLISYNIEYSSSLLVNPYSVQPVFRR